MTDGRRSLSKACALAGAVALCLEASAASAQTTRFVVPDSRAVQRLKEQPVWFEENGRGSHQSDVKFVSRGNKYALTLTRDAAMLAMNGRPGAVNGSVVHLRLVGAAEREPIGVDVLPGKTYYVSGMSGPLEGNRRFRRVRYDGVYPGIDAIYHADNDHLEFDFVVAPHVDPDRIRLALTGAEDINLADTGDLVIRAGAGEVLLKQPVAFQDIDGVRRNVPVRFRLDERSTVSFALGHYDRSRPLVIDPTISFATYIGSELRDSITSLETDASGAVYISGSVPSDATTLWAPFFTSFAQSPINSPVCYFAKLIPDGNGALSYDYIAIVRDGHGCGVMAVAPNGDVALSGPVNALGSVVRHFSNQTGTLVQTAFFTVPLQTVDHMRFDNAGLTHAVGLCAQEQTPGTRWPLPGGAQPYPVPGLCTNPDAIAGVDTQEALVIAAADGEISFGTFIGSSMTELDVTAVDVDVSGRVWVAGHTNAGLMNVTGNAYQPESAGGYDAFVVVIDPALSGPASLSYASYFGGSGIERDISLAVRPDGTVYLAGNTATLTGFPGRDFGDAAIFLSVLDLSQAPADQLISTTAVVESSSTSLYSNFETAVAMRLLPGGSIAFLTDSSDSLFPLVQPLYAGAYNLDAPNPLRPLLLVYDPAASTFTLATFLDDVQQARFPHVAAGLGGSLYVAMTTSESNRSTDTSAPLGQGDVLLFAVGGALIAPPPGLTVTPSSLNFGQVPLNKTKDLILTLTNNTGTPIALSESIAIDQSAPEPFDATDYVAPNGCRQFAARTLDPGESCTQKVRFWSVTGADAASPASLRFLDGNTFETLITVALSASVGPADEGPNTPPVPVDDLASLAPGFTQYLDAVRNDADPDNDLLRIVSVSDPPHGTAAVISCGSLSNPNSDCIRYEPDAGYTGIDAIAYTVSDGRLGTASATYHLAVGNVVPNVAAITPNSGPGAGGQAVRITGSNFVYRSNVDFVCGGSVLPLNVTQLTSTEILATTPSGSVGVCTLRVRTLFGQSGEIANAYHYEATSVDTVPVLGGLVLTPRVAINNGPESKTDPHVDGNLASYTIDPRSRGELVHYYDFTSGIDQPISQAHVDMHSDVSQGRISFARVPPGAPGPMTAMVFDVATSQARPITPGGLDGVRNTAIGGTTVAYDVESPAYDVTLWNVVTGVKEFDSASPLVADSNSNVSRDGNAVVWEGRLPDANGLLTRSNVFKAVRSGGSWLQTQVTTTDAAFNPDTDGTWIVYDDHVYNSEDDADIHLQLAAGGADIRLALAGIQRDPSISSGVIAFESRVTSLDDSDLFVYVIATNTLYQLTDTPTVNDWMSDISVLPNGDIRVIWVASDGVGRNYNVYALTFTPAAATPRASTTTLTSSPNPSHSGQQVTMTATVVAGNISTPTGTVTFLETNTNTTLGSTTLNASGQAVLTTSALLVGAHSIQATYDGDAVYGSSTASVSHNVIAPLTTSVTITSSLNPSVGAESVTFAATVSSTAGVPQGDVQFSYQVPGRPVSTDLGTVPLDASGTATVPTSDLVVGDLQVTARYLGNGTFAPASASLVQFVTPAPTSTILTSSGANAFTTRPPIFTATVSTQAPWAVVGTVEFFANGVSLGTSPIFERGGQWIAVRGGATLGVGTHEITAQYGGDTSNLGSSAGPLSQTVILGNYVTVDLTPGLTGTSSSTFAAATAVNANDQVVGYTSESDPTVGFRTDAGFIYSGGLSPLGGLGGTSTVPVAINDAGRVIGRSTTAANDEHAFSYQSGQITDLGTLAGGTTSQAVAINNSGQVVGTSQMPSGTHAFLYQGGTMSSLGTLGGSQSAARAINALGFVAGEAQLTDGTRRAAYFTNSWFDLGTLGGNTSRAAALNDANQVVGMADLAGDIPHAFLWQRGSMLDLAGAAGPASTAHAINDAGQVVGWTFNPLSYANRDLPPSPLNAFFYSGRQFTELGTLSGGTSQAVDISNSGLLIGTSDGRAFVSSGGALRDLGTLGGSSSFAFAISDRGLIVGAADTPSGASHAVVWYPVPVPTLVVPAATGPAGGVVTLSATLTLFGQPLPNQQIAFTVNGTGAGSATTDATGTATLSYVSRLGLAVGSYAGGVQANYAGSGVIVATVQATGDLTITPAPPVAADDVYQLGPGTLSIPAPGVLANDVDADGDTLSAVLVAAPAHGTVSLAADGSFTYTPSGPAVDDAFTYQAIGGGVASSTTTVSLLRILQPIFAGVVPTPALVINATPGNQNDPHLDDDVVSYTDAGGGPNPAMIRYYRFSSGIDAPVPAAVGDRDLLSDVSGPRISFSRVLTDRASAMVYDVVASQLTEIDSSAGDNRFGTTIGGNVVAFVELNSAGGDVLAWDLGSPTGTNVSPAGLEVDENPSLSRDGTVLVWQRLSQTSASWDVMMSRRSSGIWGTATAVAATPDNELNPDTDGTWIVFDSAGDIFLRPVTGGSEARLALPGIQRNANIHQGVISFESTPPAAGAKSDLHVYVIATNTLYQLTATPNLHETLSDVTVLASGDIRVVWGADDGPGGEHNIYAMTFSPANPPVDSTPPMVTMDQAAGQTDPTSASPIDFTVMFSEPVTGFTADDVSFAGSTVGGTLVASVAGSDANYTVSVVGMNGVGTVVASIPANAAVDVAGNPSAASTSTDNSVGFSTAVPTMTTVTSSPNPSMVGGLVTFTATVTSVAGPGPTPQGTVRFEDTTASTTLGTSALNASGVAGVQTSTLGVGTHAIRATYLPAVGQAYSESSGAVTQVVAIVDNPPLASFTASPNPAGCSQPVRFDASTSTPGAGRAIVGYFWNFGDGTTATGVTVNHAFSAFGDYTVTLSVADDNVPAKDATMAQLFEVSLGNLPPVANAGGPYVSDAGAGVSLNGAGSSDPNAACGDAIVTYGWDVNNDGIDDVTGATPVISPAQAASLGLGVGIHMIRLRVSDEFGAMSTATVSLTVNSANDAPVNNVPGPQATATGVPLFFSVAGGNPISIADVDAGTNPVRVTLAATNGTVTLGGTAGLTLVIGDGTADPAVTFTATIANANAALNGLRFTPSAGFTGTARLTLTTNDQSATGPLTDIDHIDITVGPAASVDLILTMTDAPDPATVGNPMTYSIQVKNSGPVGATTLTMVDVLPAGVTFLSAAPSQGRCGFVSFLRAVQCSLGSLASEQTASVTIVVRPTQRGTLTNTVFVGANQSDPNLRNNTAQTQTTVR